MNDVFTVFSWCLRPRKYFSWRHATPKDLKICKKSSTGKDNNSFSANYSKDKTNQTSQDSTFLRSFEPKPVGRNSTPFFLSKQTVLSASGETQTETSVNRLIHLKLTTTSEHVYSIMHLEQVTVSWICWPINCSLLNALL